MAENSGDNSQQDQKTQPKYLTKRSSVDKETVNVVRMWFRAGIIDRKTAILELNGFEGLLYDDDDEPNQNSSSKSSDSSSKEKEKGSSKWSLLKNLVHKNHKSENINT